MDSSLTKTIGLAAITAVIAGFSARADGPGGREAAGMLASDSGVHVDSTVTPRWVNDANILAAIGAMNARQIAAADIELSAWRSDSVRALAASLAREHADMQHQTDSLAAALHIAPIPSAIVTDMTAAFQAQIDSTLVGRVGGALDRAYLQQQVASHQLMGEYLDQFAELTERPELRNYVETLGGRVDGQLKRMQGQQRQTAVADSIVADSLAKHTRRNRQTPNR